MSSNKWPDSARGDEVDVIIQIASGHDVHAIAEQLRHAGIEVDRELQRVRVVGARMPRELIESVQNIPGIKMIRESTSFQLPPFGEDLPQ